MPYCLLQVGEFRSPPWLFRSRGFMAWTPVRPENEVEHHAKAAPHPCPSSEILDLIQLIHKEK
jgi:hypothetical protein